MSQDQPIMLTYQFQNIQNLWFYLFEGNNIPSPFQVLKKKCLYHQNYKLDLRIIGSSHIISFETNSSGLTECLTCQPIKNTKTEALIASPIRSKGEKFVKATGNIKYTMEFHVKWLEHDEYRRQHLLLLEKTEETLRYEFPACRGKSGFNPLTLLKCSCQKEIVHIWSYHTYPDEFGIVETYTEVKF